MSGGIKIPHGVTSSTLPRREPWLLLLSLFFGLVLVDGAIRKWVFPAQGAMLYFLKDVVLLAAFVLLWRRREAALPLYIRGSGFSLALGAYGLFVLLQVLNLRAPTLAVSVLGVKSHLLYLLLLFLVPAGLRASGDSLRWVRRYALWFAVPISLLAAYQYFQPPSHWINQYLSDAAVESVATAGTAGTARVTGTFSYITGMSTFVVLNLGLALGLVLAGIRVGGRTLWLGVGLLLLTLVVAPMTGSRGALYLPALALPILLIVMAGKGLVNARAALLVVLVVGAWTVLPVGGALAGWTTFLERAQMAGDDRARAEDTFLGPLQKLDAAGFLGYGVGTTHQAAPQLAPDVVPFSWLPDLYFEEENGRVGLELGILGFVAYFAVKLLLCVMALSVVRGAHSTEEVVWGTAAFIFLTTHLVAGIVFNPVAAAFYWGLAGLVLAYWSDQRVARAVRAPERLVRPASVSPA